MLLCLFPLHSIIALLLIALRTGKACLFDSRRLLARCLAHWTSLHWFQRRVNEAWRPVSVTLVWRRAADAWLAWRECAFGEKDFDDWRGLGCVLNAVFCYTSVCSANVH